MSLNPREGNEPIIGKLYRITDPHLAAFSKMQIENWETERDYLTLFGKLMHTKAVLLLKVTDDDTVFGTTITGQYLLGEKIYDFFIPLEMDDTYQTAWDKYFERVQNKKSNSKP